MSGTLNRFNWLARHYDFIAKLVFGKSIFISQVHFLDSMPKGGRLLVIGGGSGAILPYISKTNPECEIWYVEASSEMVSIASEKIPEESRDHINFIHGTEEAIPERTMFDVIITHFFLDLFPCEKGVALCQSLCGKLRPGGLWLISDFVDGGKWWQRMMLWMMYRFFVLTSTIEASSLPPWEYELRKAGMREKTFKLFFGGFIKSAVYNNEAGI